MTTTLSHADRLVSTDTVPASEIVYDDRGNNVRLGDLELEFDSADRHVRTVTPESVVSLHRDPLDRIAERTHSTRIDHVATTTATSSSASVSVARPGGVQPGDLLVVAVSSRGLVTPGSTSSAGWTNVSQQTGLLHRTAVLYRYATASDPSSWTFTSNNAGTSTAAIVAYRSTAPVAPVAVTNTASKTLATSHPVPNVTTVQDADLVIHATGLGSNVGMSTPSGTTQRAQVASGARLQVLDREQLDAGPVPGKTVSTGSAANSASVTVAFKPAVQVARYGHTGHNDASSYTRDQTGWYLGFSVPLPGGALYNWTPATGWEFSHTDLHGDVIATTALSGQYTWYGLSGPYGETASTSVPNNASPLDTTLGWHGGDNKITDGAIVHMGARPYSPTHGRFLAVDPIEGGCANDYTYVHGDPINSSDLSGTNWLSDRLSDLGRAIGNFVCSDNWFNRSFIGALSLLPPDGSSRGGKAAYAAGTNAAIWGNLAGELLKVADHQALARQLAQLSGNSIAFELKAIGAAVRLGRGLNYATAVATGYDAMRRFAC